MGKYLFRVRDVNTLSCNSTITSIFHGCGSSIVVSKSRFVERRKSNSNEFSTIVESRDGDFVAGSLSGDMLVCITNNNILYFYSLRKEKCKVIDFNICNSQIKYIVLNGNVLLLVTTDNYVYYYNIKLKHHPISWKLESSVIFVSYHSDSFVVVDECGTFTFFKYDGDHNSITCVDKKSSGIHCSCCYMCDDSSSSSTYYAGQDYCYLYSEDSKTISVLNMKSFVIEYSIPCVERDSSFHGMCCIEDLFCYIQGCTLYFYQLDTFENVGEQVFNVGFPLSFISSNQSQLLLGTEVGDLFWLIKKSLPSGSKISVYSSYPAPGGESLIKQSTFPCLSTSTEELKRKALKYIRPGKSRSPNQRNDEEALVANRMMAYALFNDDQIDSCFITKYGPNVVPGPNSSDTPTTVIVIDKPTASDSSNTTGEPNDISIKQENGSLFNYSGASNPDPPKPDPIKNKGTSSQRIFPVPPPRFIGSKNPDGTTTIVRNKNPKEIATIIRKRNPDGTTTIIRNNQNTRLVKGKDQSNQQPNMTQNNGSLSNTIYSTSPTTTTIVKHQSIVQPPPKPILVKSTQSSANQLSQSTIIKPHPITSEPTQSTIIRPRTIVFNPTRIRPHPASTLPIPVQRTLPIPSQPAQSKPIQPTQPKPVQPTQSKPIQPAQSKPLQPTQPIPIQPTQSIFYPPTPPIPVHSSPSLSTPSQSIISPPALPIPYDSHIDTMSPSESYSSSLPRSIDGVSVNTRTDHERQHVKKPDIFTASLFHINRSFNSSDLQKSGAFSISRDSYDSSQYQMQNTPPQIEELVIQTKQRINQMSIPSRSKTEKRKRLSETRRAVCIRLCQGIVNKKDISYMIRMISKLVGKDVQQLFASNKKQCIAFIMAYFQCLNLEFEKLDDILGNEPD